MKRMFLAGVLAAGVTIVPLTGRVSTVYAAEDVKLSGCLVAGEDDDDGYLLTNAMGDVAFDRVTRDKVTPQSAQPAVQRRSSIGLETMTIWSRTSDKRSRSKGN
jgi:hypothetical protein